MENTTYKVKQIWPNHADHISYYKEKWLTTMFKDDVVIAQPKYDGERMLVHFNGNEVYCTSRRHSKKTNRFMENQDKLPKIHDICIDLNYTVIDCECYANSWSEVVGVLHSLPERAEELQKEVDVKFACFDCIWYDGIDISNLPYKKRLHYLLNVLERINRPYFHPVDCEQVASYDECMTMMNKCLNAGFEGIVVKSLEKQYYDKGASLKCKKFETVDCVVIDYIKGRGKYENTIGALVIGYYDEDTDSFKRISNVNCGTDADRDLWFNNWSSMQYTVLEVKCQEITEKSLRHPVYVRIRNDKDYHSCTKSTIFKE